MMGGLAPETVAAACDGSLERLGTTASTVLPAPDDESVALADSLGAIRRAVKAGKVRAIG